jgi:hypothetical protein
MADNTNPNKNVSGFPAQKQGSNIDVSAFDSTFDNQDYQKPTGIDVSAFDATFDNKNNQGQSSNETPPTKQYKPTTTADVAKSLGSGLEMGVAEMAGFPGDVAAAGRWTTEEAKYYGLKAAEHYGYAAPGSADKYWQTVEKARQSPDREWVGPLPTSTVTTRFAKENIPGASFEPESQGGAYGHTVGEFVPTVLGGEGSLVKRLGTAAIAGLGSEALGQATEGTPYEGVARLAGAVVSPFAAEKTLSRPLGSIGSALGVSDEALGSVGLTSQSMVDRQKLIDQVNHLKSIGAFRGLPADTMEKILANEEAANVPPDQSRIRIFNAVSDSPTDVVKNFINQNSLDDPQVKDQIQRLFSTHNEISKTSDSAVSQILEDMHNEASINAINAQRDARGIPDHITEPPTAYELGNVANEVSKDAKSRIFQPIYDNHQAVSSGTLDSILPLADKDIVKSTMDEINGKRQFRGQQPYDFLTKDQNGKWQAKGFGASSYTLPFYQNAARAAGEVEGVTSGAPLEFWDALYNNLKNSSNGLDKFVRYQIPEGIDQYFTNKGLSNELQQAKNSFYGIRGEVNAIDDGMKFIQNASYQVNPAKRQAFLNNWDKLSDVEKGLYQAGLLQQIYSTLSQGLRGASDWRRIMQNQDNRQLLQTVMDFRPAGAPVRDGLSNFEKFNSALDVADAYKQEDVSKIFANTNQSRSLLGKLMAPIGTDGRSIAGILLNSAERAYLFGTPFGAITILNGGMGYIRQVLADRQARRMLNMLAARDPREAIALARDIASSKPSKTSWQKVKALLDFSNRSTINFYRRASLAANAQPQGRKEGGRVGYDDGGGVSSNDTNDIQVPPNRKLDDRGFYSKAAEALRSFPKPDDHQDVNRIVKTLFDKHDVHPDELRYTGVTTPESTRQNFSLTPFWQSLGQTPPSRMADVIERNQPDFQKKQLSGNNTEYSSYAAQNPHASDYQENVYHFPHQEIPETHQWNPDISKWKLHDWGNGTSDIYDDAGVFRGFIRNDEHKNSSPQEIFAQIAEKEKKFQQKQVNAGLNYNEGHFQTANGANPLNKSGWVRSNVMSFKPSQENPNGLKFKNLVEMQPQRAQLGEKRGIISEPYNPNVADELRKNYVKLGNQVKSDPSKKAEFLAAKQKDEDYFQKHSHDVSKVADAPYTNTVEASTRRYVKEFLNDAVKEGADGISIEPWYHNAERSGAELVSHIQLNTYGPNDQGKNLYFIAPYGAKSGFIPLKRVNGESVGFDPTNLTADDRETLQQYFGKKNTNKILQRLVNAHQKGVSAIMMSEDMEDPLMVTNGPYGHVIDGHRYYYKEYLPRVIEKEMRAHDPQAKVGPMFGATNKMSSDPEHLGVYHGARFSKRFIDRVKKLGFRTFKVGGEVQRPTRATGGRIPEIDKLFKNAKKTLDGETKPMLNVPDDAIVNALRIAQGRV